MIAVLLQNLQTVIIVYVVQLSATGWNESQTKSDASLMRSELPKTLNDMPMDPRIILPKWHANKRALILQPDIWPLYHTNTNPQKFKYLLIF